MKEEMKENGFRTDRTKDGYMGEDESDVQQELALGNPPPEQHNQYIQELIQRLNAPSVSGAMLRRLIQRVPLLPALPGRRWNKEG